jgi:hypothetical protein
MEDHNFQHISKLEKREIGVDCMQRNKISHFGTCEVDNNKAVGVMEDSY